MNATAKQKQQINTLTNQSNKPFQLPQNRKLVEFDQSVENIIYKYPANNGECNSETKSCIIDQAGVFIQYPEDSAPSGFTATTNCFLYLKLGDGNLQCIKCKSTFILQANEGSQACKNKNDSDTDENFFNSCLVYENSQKCLVCKQNYYKQYGGYDNEIRSQIITCKDQIIGDPITNCNLYESENGIDKCHQCEEGFTLVTQGNRNKCENLQEVEPISDCLQLVQKNGKYICDKCATQQLIRESDDVYKCDSPEKSFDYCRVYYYNEESNLDCYECQPSYFYYLTNEKPICITQEVPQNQKITDCSLYLAENKQIDGDPKDPQFSTYKCLKCQEGQVIEEDKSQSQGIKCSQSEDYSKGCYSYFFSDNKHICHKCSDEGYTIYPLFFLQDGKQAKYYQNICLNNEEGQQYSNGCSKIDESHQCVECFVNSKKVITNEGDICRRRAYTDDLLPSQTNQGIEQYCKIFNKITSQCEELYEEAIVNTNGNNVQAKSDYLFSHSNNYDNFYQLEEQQKENINDDSYYIYSNDSYSINQLTDEQKGELNDFGDCNRFIYYKKNEQFICNKCKNKYTLEYNKEKYQMACKDNNNDIFKNCALKNENSQLNNSCQICFPSDFKVQVYLYDIEKSKYNDYTSSLCYSDDLNRCLKFYQKTGSASIFDYCLECEEGFISVLKDNKTQCKSESQQKEYYDNRHCLILEEEEKGGSPGEYNYHCKLCKEGYYLNVSDPTNPQCAENNNSVPSNCDYIKFDVSNYTCLKCNNGYQLKDNQCQQISLICPNSPYDCHDSTQKNMILMNYCKQTELTYEQLQNDNILPNQSICKQCYSEGDEGIHTKIDLYNSNKELVYSDVCILKEKAKKFCTKYNLNFDCIQCKQHYELNENNECQILYLDTSDKDKCNGLNEDPYIKGLCTACQNGTDQLYDLYKLKTGSNNIYIKNEYKKQLCLTKLEDTYSIYGNNKQKVECQLFIKRKNGTYECYQDYEEEVSSEYKNCSYYNEDEEKCLKCKDGGYFLNSMNNKICINDMKEQYNFTCKEKSEDNEGGVCSSCPDNQILTTLYEFDSETNKYKTQSGYKDICITPETICTFYNQDLECQDTETYFIETVNEDGEVQFEQAEEAQQQLPNCLSISENQCKMCKMNYTLIGSECIDNTSNLDKTIQKKIQNCLKGEGDLENYKCIECYYGFTNTEPGQSFCSKTIPNCILYDNDGFCQECKENYHLVQFETSKQCVDDDQYSYYKNCKVANDLDENGNQINGYCNTCNEGLSLIPQVFSFDVDVEKYLPYQQLQNLCLLKEREDDILFIYTEDTEEIQPQREQEDDEDNTLVMTEKDGVIQYEIQPTVEIENKVDDCKYYKKIQINDYESKYECLECKQGFTVEQSEGKIGQCISQEQPDNKYLKNCHLKAENNQDNIYCTECNEGYILANVQDDSDSENVIIYKNVCFKQTGHCKLYNQNNKCIECMNNYQLDTIQNEDNQQTLEICSTTLPNTCQKYNSSNNCIQCKERYILEVNGENNQLINCLNLQDTDNIYLENCKIKSPENDQNNQCQECHEGYHLINKTEGDVVIQNICQKSTEFCDKFDISYNCVQCQQGFILLEEQSEDEQASQYCYSPVLNCIQYDINNTCIACENGFTLEINQEDKSMNKCLDQSLPENYYYSNCKVKNTKNIENDYCQECYKNYSLSSVLNDIDKNNIKTMTNVCLKQMNNCQFYGTDFSCKYCIDGFTMELDLTNGVPVYKCIDQQIEVNKMYNNCKVAKRNDNINEKICLECSENYESIYGPLGNDQINKKKIKQLCVYYVKHCDYYDEENKCEECQIGFDLLPLNDQQASNNINANTNANNNQLQNQQNREYSCEPYTLHCSVFAENGKCKKCKRYFNLIDGFCYLNKYSFDKCLYLKNDYQCGQCEEGAQKMKIDLEGEQYIMCMKRKLEEMGNQIIKASFLLLLLLLLLIY